MYCKKLVIIILQHVLPDCENELEDKHKPNNYYFL